MSEATEVKEWGEQPKAVRAVRSRLVADPRTGMPVMEFNHDDMVRAAWDCAREQFEPKPPMEPRSLWCRILDWFG